MTSWDLLYNILRANFDGMVEEGYCTVPEDKSCDGKAEYLYGKQVKNIDNTGSSPLSIMLEDKNGKVEKREADVLIAADGPSSTIRRILLPKVERTYAGYVAWRGTVLETEVEENTLVCFKEKFTFFHAPGMQILAYLIPGHKGTLEPGRRLINYVWYCNYAADSPEFKELMTDSDGRSHSFTLPAGKMKESIWKQQKAFASRSLPPQFAELVQKTETPFIQAITDVLPSISVFEDGKLLLVGDALAGFRPHTAGSTGQAAWHALLLGELGIFGAGEKSLESWEEEVLEWARVRGRQGIEMGRRSQFGEHPLADDR
ncbi:hypothetical protein PVAG01_02678 [Phlyctema vagabunda]|uniref:2,6-dihydroxypyridine 3-monooxygenase substrate binding domain-containing protein n=1 Tax=Phlyctema vagabunda TaxID=108571 RepID=A0ABR4PRW1_9HELO